MSIRALSLAKLVVPALLLGVGAVVARAWPVEVQGARVTAGPVTAEVLGIGTLESDHQVPVAFEASGRVLTLAVDEGDVVAAGDLLGTLDVDDAIRDLDVSSSAARAASLDVDRAKAELERGRVAADLAARERARSDALFADNDIAAAVHDVAVEKDDGAKAAVRALEAAVRRAESSRDAAAGGRRIREASLADGRLVSPISGLVVSRGVEVGQVIGVGAPAFTIIATDALEIHAWVDETALGKLDLGQPARLAFRSDDGRTYPGRVARIGRAVDRQTHELLVDVAVLEAPRNFAIGQRADVWIEVGRADAIARAPRGWCGTTCLVAEDGRVATREVSLGLVGRDLVEVVSGLRPGDVVLPDHAAADGRRITVREAP